MTNQDHQRGAVPIVVLIVALFVIGGAVAVVAYIQNNQSTLEGVVDQSQQQTQDQLAQDYPSLYIQAGLPQYPNATVTKKRQGRDLADGVQVTLKTTDDIGTIKSFFDQELGNRGFDLPNTPEGNDFAYFGIYTQSIQKLSLQITKIENTSSNKIHINYSKR